MAGVEGAEASTSIPSQLAILVPSFDPSKDDLQVYQQKIQLVLAVWPPGKLSELITRLILNTSGSAFAKLQLHQEELCVNDSKGVKRLIELLGGHWGQIGLEKKYADAERALFQCTQKSDESHDSFLARADILWTKLRTQKLQIEDLQAYITLRGSLLSSEDKKRVILESDASLEGKLTIVRVQEAIRLLGTTFFQEMTGLSKTSGKTKVYDQVHAALDETENQTEADDPAFTAQHDDVPEEEVMEALIAEGDEDACFVADFESAAADILQGDPDLSSAFSAYTEARRKLSEKVRFRGFWPVQKGRGKGKNKGKGKFKNPWSGRKSLQQRILESNCRLCGRKGHWKSECPMRSQSASSSTAASAPVTLSVGALASMDEVMPLEFMKLPEVDPPSTQDIRRLNLACVHPPLTAVPSPVNLREHPSHRFRSKGATPFLLSNTLLRALGAVVDTASNALVMPKHGTQVQLALSPKGLYLLDLNKLIQAGCQEKDASRVAETFAQDSIAEESKISESMGREEDVQKVVTGSKVKASSSAETQHHMSCQETVLKSTNMPNSIMSTSCNSEDDQSKFVQNPKDHQPQSNPVVSQVIASCERHERVDPPSPEEAIDHIPLSALKEERMSFGKTHVGKTYMEVWMSSPEWTKWFLQHYESSKKLSHRKMIRFIKLMIEETARMGNLENALHQILQHLVPEPVETFPTMPIDEETCNLKKAEPSCSSWLEGSLMMSIPYVQEIYRSTFSEWYPRRFARRVARILMKNQYPKEKPFSSLCDPALVLIDAVCAAGEREAKRQRMSAGRSKKSQSADRQSDSDHIHKKTKTMGEDKDTSSNTEACQEPPDQAHEIMQKIEKILPRVGRKVFDQPDIKQAMQEMFPEKIIKCIVACKGTERALAPPEGLNKREAPFRRAIMKLRSNGSIIMEPEWEKHDTLSQRKIVRKSLPCRVNITVFAANPITTAAPSMPPKSDPNVQAEASRLDAGVSSETVPATQEKHETQEPESNPLVAPSSEESDEIIERDPAVSQISQETPTSAVHGPRFMALPKEEQAMIKRAHQNLCHPSPEQFSALLRQQGARTELQQAVFDLSCPVCATMKKPKIARPSTVKHELDFNDKIFVDGITWTNKSGRNFHFYHIIDQATNYHVAVPAPSRTTENAIRCLSEAWLMWAGAPNMKVTDSATEFLSEAFQNFLQRHDIKPVTTAPYAHWQNGRCERHGDILQHMLSKVDLEYPVETYEDLLQALLQCTNAKNTLSIRRGYSPETLVFGKCSKLPGSLCSSEGFSSLASADREDATGIAFRRSLALREKARTAFHQADNDMALRRACLRRSRPKRDAYEGDELVTTHLLCVEDEVMVVDPIEEPCAWRCELELPNALCSKDLESWSPDDILLATTEKKQRTEDEICKLDKSAYGLIDAPFLWFKTLHDELLSLGFIASPFDPCVFLLKNPNAPVTDTERHLLRGLIGSLQYAAVHTRPDLASSLSFLQSDINKVTKGAVSCRHVAQEAIGFSGREAGGKSLDAIELALAVDGR
ncbi:unnamed protein product [Cladocopium goreaui]|uniref:Uncharacterized protein n=1 Tax=Cladocopium goreaui TaxID=2562237 RepID=A0A9P1DRD2_9DINO|nr:unnamed protein product [Cladocopium goreaui]